MRHILVSGASSLIINRLIDLLINDGFKVTGITRKLKNAHRKDINWIEADLSVENVALNIFQPIDLILHAAAISNAYNPLDYQEVNFTSTVNLIGFARKQKISGFIYISSILACKGCGMYGESKAKSEEYIKKNITNWVIIRPSQIYGHSSSNPINRIFQKIENQPLLLYPNSTAPNLFPILHSEFCESLRKVIMRSEYQNTWIITGPEKFNYYSLLHYACSVVNKRRLLIPIPGWFLNFYYNLQSKLKIPVGPTPDQIYRLYKANPDIDDCRVIRTETTVLDYLKMKPN